jgi:hypothetical protein
MTERQNIADLFFHPASPRILAYEIHEWTHATLKIPCYAFHEIQIDGYKSQVFIKFIVQSYVQALIHDTQVQTEYKHITRELSKVTITDAGMGTKTFRITNLPPEDTYAPLSTILAPY